ncbi:MAG: polyprenol monophosphomannose synthase [Candidatus Marinimicrobia bacterium]|nr:polyprenol monophosphomannose synthase [Candidatus Neomarinimicrobiota bacterium]
MRSLIVTPTYNERENIETLLERIAKVAPDCHVLVVDDSSPDGTGSYIAGRSQDEGWIHLLSRPEKLGLGTAYCAGFAWALEQGYDVIIQMDADLSHDTAQLPIFLDLIGKYDLIIGSRYKAGVNVVNWPLSRLILSWSANLYAKVITGLPVFDLTGGFKCWRQEVLAKLHIETIKSEGYAFQIETTFRAHHLGAKILETPIVFVDRVAGESKMSSEIIMEAVWIVIRLRLSRIKRWFRRSKPDSEKLRGAEEA